MAKKGHAESTWEEDNKRFPVKRGVCSCCKQKDDLKLSYDCINYICLNSHACLLRIAKSWADR